MARWAAIAGLLGMACRSAAPPPSIEAPRPMPIPMIVPAPASLTLAEGAPFTFTPSTAIVAPADSAGRAVAGYLARLLRPATGFNMPLVAEATPGIPAVRLVLDPALDSLGAEGYLLDVDVGELRLRAFRPAGLFRGVQTIRQLLPWQVESDMRVARGAWIVRPLHVADRPRMAWRGAMLDVSRHFFTVKEVREFIDLLALYKLNVLHLHLSDDQGWRLEIVSRPLLTSVGGAQQVGAGEGGFYTQAEYSSIVRYAQERHITVVPEIDMPGHSNAALTAYPALACSARPTAPFTGTEVGWSTFCVDNPETYALIDDVVRELAALTPGEYIHVGGDEVQALTPAQYVTFVERVQGIVAAHGKKMIGWEEVAQARLAPTSVAQHWRSDSVVKALAYGAKVVLSPAKRAYFDQKYEPATELGLRWAGFVTLRTAYDWDPATQVPGVHEADLLGVEAPIWTETLRNIGAVHYLAVPRIPALAEVGWTPQAGRSWDDFRGRIAAQAPRWRVLGINFYATPEIAW